MEEYCNKVKEYIETYQSNEIEVTVNGDKKGLLKAIIENDKVVEERFYIEIIDLMGAVTRILDAPHLNYCGVLDEGFTKEHFINTMNNVWTEL